MNKLKTIVVSGVVAAMSFVSVANSIELRAGVLQPIQLVTMEMLQRL